MFFWRVLLDFWIQFLAGFGIGVSSLLLLHLHRWRNPRRGSFLSVALGHFQAERAHLQNPQGVAPEVFSSFKMRS